MWRICATRPAGVPGKRPTIRTTRRCGPVMPKLASILFEADCSAWSTAHSRRMKSSTAPSGGSRCASTARVSVESGIVGVPTSRMELPCAQRHLISAVSSLNSGVPATPSRSNRTASVLVSVAPAFSQRASPTARFSSLREITASCATNTEKPPRSRSRTVWKTQTCASIPTTMACRRPVPRISRAIGFEAPQENSSLVIRSAGSRSRREATVGPSPFGYCSVATTGMARRLAARISTSAFFFNAARAAGCIAFASRSWTSMTSSNAFSRSSASAAAACSDGIALRSARRGRLRIENDVDAGDGSGLDGALQRRTDLRRLRHLLAMSAERLHHLVVARRRKLGRRALLGAEELHLWQPDLPPRGIISDDHHHRQPEPERGVEVHPVESERSVALDDEERSIRIQQLRRDSEGRAHSETPERPRIEPAARLAQRDHLRGDGDPVASVGDEHAVAGLAGDCVELLGQTEMMDGHLIGLLECCLPSGLLLFTCAKIAQPSVAAAPLCNRCRELLENAPGIPDDTDVHGAVAANLRAVAVDLDDLRRLRDPRAIREAKIERRTGDHHHVGLCQGVLAGLREEVWVIGGGAPPAGARPI